MGAPLSNVVYVLTIPVQTSVRNGHRDIATILEAIGVNVVAPLVWGVQNIDCTGINVQDFCERVHNAPGNRLLISGWQMLELSQVFVQTIEGIFIGYRSEEDAQEFLEQGWSLVCLSTSSAEFAIRAVDGESFDVYLRARALAEHIMHHFPDARWEDPAQFGI